MDGKSSIVAFLDKKLKIGNIVTLKDQDPTFKWKVVSIGQEAFKEELDKKRTWNNNI